MAKEFSIELGGKVRRLRLTHADSRALYRRFQKPMNELFWKDVIGAKDGVLNVTVNPEAQFAVLHAALKNDLPQLNEDTLDKWIADHLTAGHHTFDLAMECIRAAAMGGIINGKSFDFDELVQTNLDELGKAKEPESPEPAPTAS